jgi:hypothetical protein
VSLTRIFVVALCLTAGGASSAGAECSIFVAACHEFKLAAAVFDGTIEQSAIAAHDKASVGKDGSVIPAQTVGRALVRVNRAWKGVAAGQVIEIFGVVGGVLDVRVELSAGGRYLFYARKDAEGRLWAQGCERMRTLAEAADDIAH